MTKQELSLRRKFLREENRKCSDLLQPVAQDKWPTGHRNEDRRAVFRSKAFLVQVYCDDGTLRLSINRTELEDSGRFADGLTWDDLMRVKEEAGFGDRWAVEVYPPDSEVVNVSNMRHIWLLEASPAFAWRKNKPVKPCQPHP